MNLRRQTIQTRPLPPFFLAAFGALAAQLDHRNDASEPSFTWNKWEVMPHGADPAAARVFHVLRESKDGTRRETIRNEVGRTKMFRTRANADQACDEANAIAHPRRVGDQLHWPDGRVTDLNGIEQPQFVGGAA